ncbi:Clavaminate synthase-like protein [Rhizopogon salebrosus TDB-379]|nr:Clavaminate synthase-like protein [Rhizopogon salebrosus TDB-379]
MAPSRRRVTRSAAQKSQERSPSSSRSSLTPMEDEQVEPTPTESAPTKADEDACPSCREGVQGEKSDWIRCDACKVWFHWACAGNGGELELINKWYCDPCMVEKPSRVMTLKLPARKSSRKRTQLDYASLNAGVESDPSRWLRVIQSKPIKDDNFRRMKGADVGLEWLENDETAMREPIVVEDPEGLIMKMPPPEFTVQDVADQIGHETPVEVIDVATQSNSPGWTLGRWAEYYNTDPSKRDKIRNVISLEISGTKLADQVLPPRLVRELDWVEKFWPSTRKGKGHAYPKVQLYCLMGVASAWTDWHVDFAGSSVYYHILRGCKVFYFIRPTSTNFQAYERWSGTEMQSNVWLGDMVDEVVKVTLHAGNTMIIPTGWIHAVHTPVDSLVFGGNFLHSYNVATQLKVIDIEKATHVPKKFRFPLFVKLCWYVGDKYLRDLRSKEEFPPRVLDSLEALSRFLVSESRTMERGTEAAKREAKENVPSDRVKDAPAMARELRWRVRLAAGTTSDDEGLGHSVQKNMVNGHKRKRSPASSTADVQFKNFKPKGWDVVNELPRESGERVVNVHPPTTSDVWEQKWTDWNKELEDGDAGEQATVERAMDVVIKVRKTEGGVERQRIERVMEKWVWKGVSLKQEGDARDVEMKTIDDGFVGSSVPALLETQAMEVVT